MNFLIIAILFLGAVTAKPHNHHHHKHHKKEAPATIPEPEMSGGLIVEMPSGEEVIEEQSSGEEEMDLVDVMSGLEPEEKISTLEEELVDPEFSGEASGEEPDLMQRRMAAIDRFARLVARKIVRYMQHVGMPARKYHKGLIMPKDFEESSGHEMPAEESGEIPIIGLGNPFAEVPSGEMPSGEMPFGELAYLGMIPELELASGEMSSGFDVAPEEMPSGEMPSAVT